MTNKSTEFNQPNKTQARRPLISSLSGDIITAKDKKPPTITILKPISEVYEFIRNFSNLAKFMSEFNEVKTVSEKVSQWMLNDESDSKLGWETETSIEKRNELIQWTSKEGSVVKQSGAIWFQDAGDRGTVVSLKITYEKTPGSIANGILQLIGQDSDTQSLINLRKLKAVLETGEFATIEGQPNGKDEDENLKH